MSSRKKNILATIVLESPNKTAHIPSGVYEIAIRRSYIENGSVKIEAIIVKEIPNEPNPT